MEQRNNTRVNKKLMVSFGDEGYESLGLTSNISRDGMLILSNKIYSMKRDRICLSVALPMDIYTIKGEIVRIIPSGNNNSEGMGIKFRKVPKEYLEFIENIK